MIRKNVLFEFVDVCACVLDCVHFGNRLNEELYDNLDIFIILKFDCMIIRGWHYKLLAIVIVLGKLSFEEKINCTLGLLCRLKTGQKLG